MTPGKIIIFITVSFFLLSCKAQQVVVNTQEEKPTPAIHPPSSPPKPITEIKTPVKPEKKEIKLALLLPLFLDKNLENDTAAQPFILPQSQNALAFYEGALLAKDSLQKKDIDLELSVLDIGEDTSARQALLLNHQMLKSNNLVIANFISSQCSTAASIAGQLSMNLVLTQYGQTSMIEKNSHVALAVPASYTQCRLMSKFCYDSYKDDNVAIVSGPQKREIELAAVFKSSFDSLYGNLNVTFISKGDTSLKSLNSYIDSTKSNLIIIPSSDESYVSSLLNVYDRLERNIKVVGLPTWENFETVHLGKYENLQVLIFSSTWLDLESENIKALRKKIIDEYKTDITFHSCLGFQLCMLMAETIDASDDNFLENIPLASLSSDILWFSRLDDGGYENLKFSVLWFKNYELIKINK